MEKRTLQEVFAAFTCKPQYLNDMDPNDPFAGKAKEVEALFTGGVLTLKSLGDFNPIISDLMSYVWDVFHHRHVVMAMGPDVPALSFALSSGKDGLQALVFAPHNWADRVKDNPLMQLGAIVSIGSQVADYYNGRITGRIDLAIARGRAESYEAEYLKMLKNQVLNEYQLGILAKHPDGFDSTQAYARKPVLATN